MRKVTPLMKRIAQLKGVKSYAALSEEIYRKTQKHISDKALHHIASGLHRMPREKTLQILAEYAEKPISWFYEEEPTLASALVSNNMADDAYVLLSAVKNVISRHNMKLDSSDIEVIELLADTVKLLVLKNKELMQAITKDGATALPGKEVDSHYRS